MGNLKEIVVNGGIREKNGKFVLTIYSSPFARYLLSNGTEKVNLEFDEENAVIKPGNIKKMTIERKREEHPLIVISVAKIMTNELKEKVKSYNAQLPIKIFIRDFVFEKDLVEYNNRINRAEPKEWDISTPKDNLLKIACYVSCFRQNGKRWYRFTVRHRIFEQIIKRKVKVNLCRAGKEFFLKSNPNGNKMNLYKNKDGYVMAYMQISPSFLTNEEMDLFEKGRSAISFKVFLCNKDLGFDISEFFYDKQEKELAKELINRGISIQVPRMGKREADILLPDIKGQIEVTSVMPVRVAKNKNNAHGEGVHINARICEGFVRVINNKINKFFVVLHKDWMEYQWIKDLYEMIKPKVILIPTDFKVNWTEKAVHSIADNL